MTHADIKYSIDSGVPVPVRTAQVPIKDLKVGDSILFNIDSRAKVQARASTLKRTQGKEFTVKKVNNTEARVWRTK